MKPDKFSPYNPYTINNIKLYCKLYRPEYEFLSNEYINTNTKYLWKYNGEFYKDYIDVDRTFLCSSDNFINANVKHPLLTKSNFEIAMLNIIKENDIKYVEQKTFTDCKDKYLLRFDFEVIDLNGNNVLIETDGMQHEITVEMWGGTERLEDTIRKDNIKNKYCQDNNIKLIRIPYNKINHIEEILIENNIIKQKSK